ncbi:Y-family DNA polymerase [Hyunsoonleella pacifica]|uniref:Y-family DNA polymerase n=1 Tax=Hyunsoonleella pacifica TaxID=1080224 RepID=A0A4Q9FS98_9FLAO|nr:Y-family DNA polymerase [Hyunsoonleella pacifica]TBN16504.1 Y-family DNA polymerase [Hyunsoonleella pacifica]GGD18842.1 SOS mutagenesis and repair protein UmuC [Hyunsoonleella pacifica]
MYALVDCNNFYASCERVFNPNLQHKPIAILSNNDGCVISRSDEAKALKLPMGAPIFKWESFCKANGIEVLSSNYPLYGDMSHRVMTILEQFTPDVEIYSIDEAFLEFKGFKNHDFTDYGNQIRQRILKWTGIPTCVGIAPTKALSKVANKIARKFPETTKGVYVIDSEEKRIKALKWIKIESVWGIGRGLQKRLKAKGCKSAIDFVNLSDTWVRKNFGSTGFKLKKDLEGVPQLELDESTTKRAIATTRSFDYSYDDLNYIKERISTFATSCAEKLRKQGSSCHIIYVTLQSNRHKRNIEQHRESRVVSLPYPTDSSLVISREAVRIASQIFKKGIKYKRAGVIVMGLVPTNNYQLQMFDAENPKHKPLMTAIDKLNEKYADYKVKLGNQDLERTWKMRQERLSPRYTTNINEIIVVK